MTHVIEPIAFSGYIPRDIVNIIVKELCRDVTAVCAMMQTCKYWYRTLWEGCVFRDAFLEQDKRNLHHESYLDLILVGNSLLHLICSSDEEKVIRSALAAFLRCDGQDIYISMQRNFQDLTPIDLLERMRNFDVLI